MTSRVFAAHRRPVALAMVIILLAQLPGITVAHHGGREIGTLLNCNRPVEPPRCTSVGDDRMHRVHLDRSLSPALAAAMRYAMGEVYDPTRLTLVEHEEVTRRTDVIAYSGDFGDNGAAAWVHCPADAPQGENVRGDRWCRHQELFFNLNPRYGVFFDDAPSRRHVACHELGHTLGLRHWGNPPQTDGPAGETCMNANTPNGHAFLHPTDVDHINAYPYTLPRNAPTLRLVQTPSDTATAVAEPSGSESGLVDADEVERPASLAGLVQDADLVTVGRIVAVGPGRAFGPAHKRLHYAALTVALHEVLAGGPMETGAVEVTLELPLHDGLDGLARLGAAMLGTERLLFLRNKGVSAAEAGLPISTQLEDAPFYRLVTFGSEVVSVDGVAVAGGDDAGLLDRFDGLPFTQVVKAVRAAAG